MFVWTRFYFSLFSSKIRIISRENELTLDGLKFIFFFLEEYSMKPVQALILNMPLREIAYQLSFILFFY